MRAYLRVSGPKLEAWMEGEEPLPVQVFLQCVDVVVAPMPRPLSETIRRSWEARGRAEHILARTSAAHARAAASVAQSAALLRTGVLEAALNAVVKGTAAARGNIQLVRRDGLYIAAQVGFEKPFLDFFATVRADTPSTCGRAHEHSQRVIVADVLDDPIFRGTAAAGIMSDAGALACQSTPLLGSEGLVIGMLSTHYEKPHQPSTRELDVVDRVAGALAGTLSR